MHRFRGVFPMLVLLFAASVLSGCPVPLEAIQLSKTEINFERSELPEYLQVWNDNPEAGGVTLDVVASHAWIVPEVAQVECPAPASASGPYTKKTIKVTVDRRGLTAGTYQGSITFSAGEVVSRSVTVRLIQDEDAPVGDVFSIIDPEVTYTEPYLIDIGFSLRDAEGGAVVAEPAAFDLEVFEGDTPLAGPETGVHLKRAVARQLRVDLVLDYSLSMQIVAGAIAAMEDAAKNVLLPALNADAQVGLVEFHVESTPPLRVSGFTVDRAYLREQIDAIQDDIVAGFYGGSRAWDAMLLSLEAFNEENPTQEARYIVLFSDGNDTSSLIRVDEIIAEAQARGVRVFAIGFGDDVDADTLDNLADATGGAYFPADSVEELDEAFAKIVEALGGQYILRWASLRRNDALAFRPSFTIHLGGDSDFFTGGETFAPSEHAGDELRGLLRLVPSDNEVSTTVFLRADYVPRAITAFSFFISSAFTFQTERVDGGDDGLLAGWDMAITEDAARGGIWIDLESGDGSPVPFATFGPLLRLNFGQIGDEAIPLFNTVYVDNTIYGNGQHFEIDGYANNLPEAR